MPQWLAKCTMPPGRSSHQNRDHPPPSRNRRRSHARELERLASSRHPRVAGQSRDHREDSVRLRHLQLLDPELALEFVQPDSSGRAQVGLREPAEVTDAALAAHVLGIGRTTGRRAFHLGGESECRLAPIDVRSLVRVLLAGDEVAQPSSSGFKWRAVLLKARR